jgi:hypothetical protein
MISARVAVARSTNVAAANNITAHLAELTVSPNSALTTSMANNPQIFKWFGGCFLGHCNAPVRVGCQLTLTLQAKINMVILPV